MERNLPCGLAWLGKLEGDTLEPWTRPAITREILAKLKNLGRIFFKLTIRDTTAGDAWVHGQCQWTAHRFATILIWYGPNATSITVLWGNRRAIVIRFNRTHLVRRRWVASLIWCVVRSSWQWSLLLLCHTMVVIMRLRTTRPRCGGRLMAAHGAAVGAPLLLDNVSWDATTWWNTNLFVANVRWQCVMVMMRGWSIRVATM